MVRYMFLRSSTMAARCTGSSSCARTFWRSGEAWLTTVVVVACLRDCVAAAAGVEEFAEADAVETADCVDAAAGAAATCGEVADGSAESFFDARTVLEARAGAAPVLARSRCNSRAR